MVLKCECVCGIGKQGQVKGQKEKSDGNTKVQAAMVRFYTMEGHQHECSHMVFPAVSIILESILAHLEPIMNKDYNKNLFLILMSTHSQASFSTLPNILFGEPSRNISL